MIPHHKIGGADALVCAGPPGLAVANVVNSYEGQYTSSADADPRCSLLEVRQTLVIHSKQIQETGMQIMQLCSGGKKGSEVGWDGHNECDQNRQFMAAPCSIRLRITSTSCAEIDFLAGWHLQIASFDDGFQQQACARVPRLNGRAACPAFQRAFASSEIKAGHLRNTMAARAIFLENLRSGLSVESRRCK